jgi:hypothetical protein
MLKVYLETIFQLYPQLITRLVVKSGLFAYLQTISTILLPSQNKCRFGCSIVKCFFRFLDSIIIINGLDSLWIHLRLDNNCCNGSMGLSTMVQAFHQRKSLHWDHCLAMLQPILFRLLHLLLGVLHGHPYL